MLHVSPGQILVRLEGKGTDAGSQRRRRGRAGVAAGTVMVQVCRDDLLLTRCTRTVGGGKSGRARFAIPRYEAVFGRTANGQGPNAICVAVAIAIVVVSASVPGRPHENGTLATATLIKI